MYSKVKDELRVNKITAPFVIYLHLIRRLLYIVDYTIHVWEFILTKTYNGFKRNAYQSMESFINDIIS